jgi:CubicO group peptidase (beta-lactamase class C family)
MRTGLDWDEWNVNYSDPQNINTLMANSDDWHKFVLDRPMAAAAGSEFVYNSGVSNLLAGVIRTATGQTTWEFADEALFGPLGIDDHRWRMTPDSIAITGWGLQLRSRDMARFGLLYLQRGVWDGERVLSEAWIDESMEAATRFTDGGGYGYQWWLGSTPSGSDRAVTSAQGWGGQFIVVIPALDAVVVTTQGNYGGLEGLVPSRLVEVLQEAALAGV